MTEPGRRALAPGATQAVALSSQDTQNSAAVGTALAGGQLVEVRAELSTCEPVSSKPVLLLLTVTAYQ